VKGVRISPGAVHLCYCHSPMRYLWNGFEAYRSGMRGITKLAFTAAAGRVRRWDAAAAKNVTHFVANSHYVAERIRRCYGRDAEVIPPPIDLHRAVAVAEERPGDRYLCAGRLVPYKRTEILIEACRRSGRRLRIAGAGPEEARLRQLTAGDARVEFLGELPTDELWREYARCRALLFAADEDFGMVPLEAQACGRPVIAFGTGGSLETVRGVWSANDPPVKSGEFTGLYFAEQTANAATAALELWERELEPRFQSASARRWAADFATPLFLKRYREAVLRWAPQAAAECVPAEQAAAALLA
jgi:glycosyltransferase involved in cell wall biosynthesis